MKFEWEKICDKDFNITYRAKVLGGWLVNNVYRAGDNKSPAIVFIEDKKHLWSTEEENYLDEKIEDFIIYDTYFSQRIINCLKAESIYLIRDLLIWCEHQLYLTTNLGVKSLLEIKHILKLAGLELDSYPHIKLDAYNSKCRECILHE